jgi:hypothetical protein
MLFCRKTSFYTTQDLLDFFVFYEAKQKENNAAQNPK